MTDNRAFSVNVVCDANAIRQRYRPPFALVCPFYVSIGDKVFPDVSWDDFVVPVLANWLEQVTIIRKMKDAEIKLRFMEGSHYIRVSLGSDEYSEISFVKVIGGKEIAIDKLVMKFDDLARAIYKTARLLSDAIITAGIEDKDHKELKKCIELYEKQQHA